MVLHKSSAAYSCECGASDADGLAMVDTSIEQVAQVRAQRGSGTADTASTARLRTRLSANVAGTICGVAMVRSGPVRKLPAFDGRFRLDATQRPLRVSIGVAAGNPCDAVPIAVSTLSSMLSTILNTAEAKLCLPVINRKLTNTNEAIGGIAPRIRNLASGRKW
jgi:hypothetical protein